MKQKHRYLSYLVLLLAIAILTVGYFLFPNIKNFASPNFVREFLLGFGIWSYPIFIILLILAVPLPLPTTPIAIGGGYLYGTLQGTLLSLVALVIGSSIAFLLVRMYGKPLLERMVDAHHIEHFNHVFKRRGLVMAFVSYIVPIFPTDCVSLFLGFTKTRFRDFIVIVTLGHIPRLMIINSVGDSLFSGFSIVTVIAVALAVVMVGIAIFKEKIKLLVFNELKEIKKEVVITEKRLGWK